jgi:4-carboxymuconolactone decarboxylase
MSEPGPEVMARFVGAENVERGRDYLEQLDPELHRYIIDFVYGEVYAGDALDPKTRALCTVAMLATLDQQLQLGVYVQAARRQGATEQEHFGVVPSGATRNGTVTRSHTHTARLFAVGKMRRDANAACVPRCRRRRPLAQFTEARGGLWASGNHSAHLPGPGGFQSGRADRRDPRHG